MMRSALFPLTSRASRPSASKHNCLINGPLVINLGKNKLQIPSLYPGSADLFRRRCHRRLQSRLTAPPPWIFIQRGERLMRQAARNTNIFGRGSRMVDDLLL